jgi:hypothetical protein
LSSKCDTIGPDIFEGPSHKEKLLLELLDVKSNVFSLRNIGCGGIGPIIDERP